MKFQFALNAYLEDLPKVELGDSVRLKITNNSAEIWGKVIEKQNDYMNVVLDFYIDDFCDEKFDSGLIYLGLKIKANNCNIFSVNNSV